MQHDAAQHRRSAAAGAAAATWPRAPQPAPLPVVFQPPLTAQREASRKGNEEGGVAHMPYSALCRLMM